MSSPRPASPPMSLVRQFGNFVSATSGLDLTLRLIHSIAIIASEVYHDKAIAFGCATAAMELAQVRRYLRFFGFIGCLRRSYGLLVSNEQSKGSLKTTLGLVESTCLALYLILEDSTILHDMNIYHVSWHRYILVEANKFWFYAISATIARLLSELFLGSGAPPEPKKMQSKSERQGTAPPPPTPAPSTFTLLRRIIATCCDLSLPAAFVGWVAPGSLRIGMAMFVSTTLAWTDAWTGVQEKEARAEARN